MVISVECQGCGQPYTVDEKFLGQRVKCKQCGSIFALGTPREAPPPVPDDGDPFSAASIESGSARAVPSAPENVLLPTQTPTDATVVGSPQYYRAAEADFPVGRGNRGDSIGLDPLTPYILMLFGLMSIVGGVYATIQLYTHADNSHEASASAARVWAWVVVGDVLFFAIIAPLLFAGVVATSRIFNFRMVGSGYLRACGAAALPTLLIVIANAEPGIAQVLLYVVAAGLVFALVKWIFDLDWVGGAVSFALGAMGWALGLLLASLALSPILSGNLLSIGNPASADDGTSGSSRVASNGGGHDAGTSNSGATSEPPVSLSTFRDEVYQKTASDLGDATYEDKAPEVDAMQKQLAAYPAAVHSDPDYQAIAGAIADFAKKVAALPHNRIDPAIFAETGETDDWTTGALSRGKLGDEVWFKQFKFRPALDLQLDPNSSQESPDGLIWTTGGKTPARLSIQMIPRTLARQRWPLITETPALLRIAGNEGLYTIKASKVTTSFGQINGITFEKIASDTDAPGTPWERYITAIGDSWLILNLELPADNKPLARIMDASARTIRNTSPETPPKASPTPNSKP